MYIKGLNYKLEPIRTIGDGSCLIHAILQSFSKEYLELKSDTEKSKLAKEVRFHLSEILDLELPEEQKIVYQYLSRGELEDLSKVIPEASLEAMKKELNSSSFLTFQYIELLCEIFDINIIFISKKEGDIYYLGDSELFYKKNRDNILINYIDQCHFETIKVKNKTIFNYKNPLIQDIEKYKKIKFY